MKEFFDYKSLLQNKEKTIRVAMILLLILAALFLFLFQTGDNKHQEAAIQSEVEDLSGSQSDIPSGYIIVDVSGAVLTPAVIELPLESRINDAILAAGGLTKEADISQINRAAPLTDGEKIYIPTKQQTAGVDDESFIAGQIPNDSGPGQTPQINKININQAELSKLQEIPGVGPATAEKIISYRKEHGLFRKLEDLKKVSGIGDKTFEKMKSYICI